LPRNFQAQQSPRKSYRVTKSKQRRLAQSLFSSPAIHRREPSHPIIQPDSSGFVRSFS
jgi:hypothetical protein